MPTKKSSGAADSPCDSPAPKPALPDTPGAAPAGTPRTSDRFLGHARAVLIVCKCANTVPANLPRTLAELGVNGIPFQQSVRTAVKAAGYAIGADDVPGAPGTRLVQVVTIIQNARRNT
jgi:hypothetical protein